jgi:dynein heavy chain
MASISVALYGRVRAALLPTPAKAHYQFNVRQVAEVTQGLLMVTSNTVEQSTQKLALLHKLWVHEARRVFTDRLVDEADQQLVEGLLRDVVLQARDALGADVDLSEPEMAPSKLLFCNFAEPGSADYQLAASTVRA